MSNTTSCFNKWSLTEIWSTFYRQTSFTRIQRIQSLKYEEFTTFFMFLNFLSTKKNKFIIKPQTTRSPTISEIESNKWTRPSYDLTAELFALSVLDCFSREANRFPQIKSSRTWANNPNGNEREDLQINVSNKTLELMSANSKKLWCCTVASNTKLFAIAAILCGVVFSFLIRRVFPSLWAEKSLQQTIWAQIVPYSRLA